MCSSIATRVCSENRQGLSRNQRRSYNELTAEQASIVDNICDEFEASWKRGIAPDFRAFVDLQPECLQNGLLDELFQIELQYREETDPAALIEVYRDQFPNWNFGLILSLPTPAYTDDSIAKLVVEPLIPFDEYEELIEVGRGGMGIVYQARDKRLGRLVCLKALPRESASNPDRLQRFEREARAISSLNHPNICTIYDLKETDREPYLVLEWIEGLTLRAAFPTPPTMQAILPIAKQIAVALAAAHSAAIIHRDIKPENVMVRPDGIVKILDFGLARLRNNSEMSIPTDDATAIGMVLGTIHYMSPEQARGESVDDRSDIFSFGTMLYELTTGERPFAGANLPRLLGSIEYEIPNSPAQMSANVRPDFSFLIMSMLDKNPAQRPSAKDIVDWFDRLSESSQSNELITVVSSDVIRRTIVGRDEELEALQQGFQTALSGRGYFQCVSGEPGIGKTSLVEEFLQRFASRDRFILVQGRCSERLAGTEAYLPVLDALERLLSTGNRVGVSSILKSTAPSWYVMVTSELLETQNGIPALPSQEKLKREFRIFLSELSRVRPVILYLDDIHWADASTIDLLSYLANDIATMRVVVLLTFRPADLELRNHPFKQTKLELESRGICREQSLGFIDSDAIQQYLDFRYGLHAFPCEFAELLLSRTEGNPMFVANLLQFLQDRGIVDNIGDRWRLASPEDSIQGELPGSIRSLLEKRLSLVSEQDLNMLRAAAVQGYEFDAVVASHALELDQADVEERLEALAVKHAIIKKRSEKEFPDGTLSNRYQFVHGLYQNVIFDGLQPARRAVLSRAVACSLQKLYAHEQSEIASELALLWEASRDWTRSAECFNAAAQHANGLFAYRESLELAQRGLAVLNKQSESPARAMVELQLQGTLGAPLLATKGYSASEVGAVQQRVYELSKILRDRELLIRSTRQLHSYYLILGEVSKSLEHAEVFVADVHQSGEKHAMIEAYSCRALSLCHLARVPECFRDFDKLLSLCDVETAASQEKLIALNPRVLAISTKGWLRWFLGEVDTAIQEQLAALTLCDTARLQSNDTPSFSRIHTLFVHSLVSQHRREVDDVARLSQLVIDHSTAQGNAFYHAMGMIWQGWAIGQQGELSDGLRQIEAGYQSCLALGSRACEPHILGMKAEFLGRLNRIDEAVKTIEAALRSMNTTGQLLYQADLLRVQGELVSQTGSSNSRADAEACFRQALQVARARKFRSLELRAATSLFRHMRGTAGETDARQQLAEVHVWFSEGTTTLDWLDANALLQSLTI